MEKKLTYRSATIPQDTLDKENRRAMLSFSSDTPAQMWDWDGDFMETLSHEPGAMNTEFIGSGRAPVLWMHDHNVAVGVVESVAVENGKGKAVVRFGKSSKAEEVWSDVVDGILGNVSVGYTVEEQHDGPKENGTRSKIVTRWTPWEVSIVSVPADTSVGVGRAKNLTESPQEETKMTQEVKNETTAIDVEAVRKEATQNERARVDGIRQIANRFGLNTEAQDFINSGKSVDEFRQVALEKIATKKEENVQATTTLDLSNKERKQYSLMKAIRAAYTKDWTEAGLEREASNEIAKRLNRMATGFFVPMDYFAQRAMSVGGSNVGGDFVATELHSNLYIPPLYNKLVVKQLGATVLTGLVGDVDIPGGNGVTAGWIDGEDVAAGEVTPGSRLVQMSPKTVGAYTYITRKLLQQSSMGVEMIVRDALENALAQAIDAAAINGTGANGQPTGILNTSGIGAGSSLGATGGDPTWALVNELVSKVDLANLMGTAFLTNAKVTSKLATTPKVSSTDSVMIMNERDRLIGYPVATTNNVPSNLAKSTSGNVLSALIFGDFSHLFIGEWGVIDLSVSDSDGTTFQKGGLTVRALQDIDVAVRYAGAFAASKEIATA